MTRVKSFSRRRIAIAATSLAIVTLIAVVPWRLVAQEPTQQSDKTTGANTAKPQVRVQCVDTEGKPVAGAELHLFQHTGGDAGRYLHRGPVTTDANGKADCGACLLTDEKAGTFDRWIYARIRNRLVGIARSVQWKNREVVNPDFKVVMYPSRSVEGRVTVPEGFDPSAVTVSIKNFDVIHGAGDSNFTSLPRYDGFPGLDTALPEVFECQPDTDGRFRLQDVPVRGRLYLATISPSLGEAQWRNSNDTFDEAIHLTIEKEGIVTGRITAPTGKPAANVEVSVRLSGADRRIFLQSTFRTATNKHGEFSIRGLPEGTVALYVQDPEKRWVVRPQEQLAVHPEKSLSVEINMEVGVLVSGKVLSPDGKPVEGAGISAVTGSRDHAGLDDDLSDAEGNYRLRLPSGVAELYFNSLPPGFDYPKPQIVKRLEIKLDQAPIEGLDFVLAKTKQKSTNQTKNPASPNIIIAEHVLLWEGKEVVTWDEVVARLRKLRPAGPFHANFYFTNAVSTRNDGENWQFWQDRINGLYRELFEPAGVSFSSISPLNGGKFDAIRTAKDLIPDPRLARTGRVFMPDGKLAANAQIVLLPTTGVNDIALNGTKLRDRFNSDWLPANDAGEFTIHPHEKEYLIVALHPAGFLLQHGSADEDKLLKLDLQLRPWATIAISSSVAGKKQAATISASPLGRDHSWPYFNIYEIEAKNEPAEIKVPPGAITVARSFKLKQGASRSVPAESFEIQPDERRDVKVQPADDADEKDLLGDVIEFEGLRSPEPTIDLDPTTAEETKKDSPANSKLENNAADKEIEDRQGVKLENHRIHVVGNATDAKGKPIQDAEIFLVSTNGSPEKLLGRTTTDKNGFYEFRDAKLGFISRPGEKNSTPAGSFEVFGKAKGYAFAWQPLQYVYLHPRPGGGIVLGNTFIAGEKMETRLRFALPHQVSGQFTDDKGNPIRGIKVEFRHCDNSGNVDGSLSDGFWAMRQAAELMPELLRTTSDVEGRFQFSAVPPETMCLLKFSHPDYGEKVIYTSTAKTPPKTYDDGHPVEPLPLKIVLHKTRKVSIEVQFADSDKPAAGVPVDASQMRASGNFANGTSDKNGKVEFNLPPGKYRLRGEPKKDLDYVRTAQDLTVAAYPPEQSTVLRINPGCVLLLRAIDADTGQGIPHIKFWNDVELSVPYQNEVRVVQHRAQVAINTTWGDPSMTNEKGEMRAVVDPGKRKFGIGYDGLPEDYYAIDEADVNTGRELELPAGKTVTVEFKLRKK